MAPGDRLRRPVNLIARKVSWSPDGQSVLAAVGEGDADIVLLTGLIPTAGRSNR